MQSAACCAQLCTAHASVVLESAGRELYDAASERCSTARRRGTRPRCCCISGCARRPRPHDYHHCRVRRLQPWHSKKASSARRPQFCQRGVLGARVMRQPPRQHGEGNGHHRIFDPSTRETKVTVTPSSCGSICRRARAATQMPRPLQRGVLTSHIHGRASHYRASLPHELDEQRTQEKSNVKRNCLHSCSSYVASQCWTRSP